MKFKAATTHDEVQRLVRKMFLPMGVEKKDGVLSVPLSSVSSVTSGLKKSENAKKPASDLSPSVEELFNAYINQYERERILAEEKGGRLALGYASIIPFVFNNLCEGEYHIVPDAKSTATLVFKQGFQAMEHTTWSECKEGEDYTIDLSDPTKPRAVPLSDAFKALLLSMKERKTPNYTDEELYRIAVSKDVTYSFSLDNDATVLEDAKKGEFVEYFKFYDKLVKNVRTSSCDQDEKLLHDILKVAGFKESDYSLDVTQNEFAINNIKAEVSLEGLHKAAALLDMNACIYPSRGAGMSWEGIQLVLAYADFNYEADYSLEEEGPNKYVCYHPNISVDRDKVQKLEECLGIFRELSLEGIRNRVALEKAMADQGFSLDRDYRIEGDGNVIFNRPDDIHIARLNAVVEHCVMAFQYVKAHPNADRAKVTIKMETSHQEDFHSKLSDILQRSKVNKDGCTIKRSQNDITLTFKNTVSQDKIDKVQYEIEAFKIQCAGIQLQEVSYNNVFILNSSVSRLVMRDHLSKLGLVEYKDYIIDSSLGETNIKFSSSVDLSKKGVLNEDVLPASLLDSGKSDKGIRRDIRKHLNPQGYHEDGAVLESAQSYQFESEDDQIGVYRLSINQLMSRLGFIAVEKKPSHSVSFNVKDRESREALCRYLIPILSKYLTENRDYRFVELENNDLVILLSEGVDYELVKEALTTYITSGENIQVERGVSLAALSCGDLVEALDFNVFRHQRELIIKALEAIGLEKTADYQVLDPDDGSVKVVLKDTIQLSKIQVGDAWDYIKDKVFRQKDDIEANLNGLICEFLRGELGMIGRDGLSSATKGHEMKDTLMTLGLVEGTDYTLKVSGTSGSVTLHDTCTLSAIQVEASRVFSSSLNKEAETSESRELDTIRRSLLLDGIKDMLRTKKVSDEDIASSPALAKEEAKISCRSEYSAISSIVQHGGSAAGVCLPPLGSRDMAA